MASNREGLDTVGIPYLCLSILIIILFKEKNRTRFSTSLCSSLDRLGLFEDFNQCLSTDNNLSPEDIPQMRRRQSMDVSKISSCLPVDCEKTLLMPSIKITHHSSSLSLNTGCAEQYSTTETDYYLQT